MPVTKRLEANKSPPKKNRKKTQITFCIVRGAHAGISLTRGRGMTGSRRSGLFRAEWRHRTAGNMVT